MTESGIQIMIVDDNAELCGMLSYLIEKDGFNAQVVYDGEIALKTMRCRAPDVALLDIKIPGMDGMEVLKRVKEIDPDIRIIIVSGYFYKDDVVIPKALEEGLIGGFIGKPFFHDEILKGVKTPCSS